MSKNSPSGAGLGRAKRKPGARIPVSWIDANGEKIPLSFDTDDRIDLSPYISNPASGMTNIYVSKVPERWRASFLDIVMKYWKHGRPGSLPPKASGVVLASRTLTRFILWLSERDIWRFRDVTSCIFREFATYLIESPTKRARNSGGTRVTAGVENILLQCVIPWELRSLVIDPMLECPYPSRGGLRALFNDSRSREAKTYCLSESEYAALYSACERELIGADEIIEMISVLQRLMRSNFKRSGPAYKEFRRTYSMEPAVARRRFDDIRCALATQLLMLVGMRISELLALQTNAFFSRQHGDQTLYWVRGKTFKGSRAESGTETEWMATKRIGWLIDRLSRIAGIHRPVLMAELYYLEMELAEAVDAKERAQLARKVNAAKRDLLRLFLVVSGRGPRVRPNAISVPAAPTVSKWLKHMAKKAGLTCPMSPHVLRRSFAYMVVKHCQGDVRYLKKHFQHWSIETTQLYVTHAGRDKDLADEIGRSMLESKTEIVAAWLHNESLLSGRAGEWITNTRSRPEFKATIREDRLAMARSLAQGLTIRPTGHSWCISEGSPPCGGRGLYDALSCANCDGAVVTEKELSIWLGLEKQMSAAAACGDVGPGGSQAIERGLIAIRGIVEPLVRNKG